MIRTILLGLGIATAAFAQGNNVQIGNWLITTTTDPMDDTTRVVAFLPSDHPEVGLALRCEDGEPDVIIGWGNELGDGPEHEIQLRFPPARPVTQRWSRSASRQSLLSGNPVDFYKALVLGSRHPDMDGTLVVRTQTSEGRFMTASLDLDGANFGEATFHVWSCFEY